MKSIFIFLIGVSFLHAWEPDVRLTSNYSPSLTSLNNARCVASTESYVHVVWSDERDENEEIYYKRPTNNGGNWNGDRRLTDNPASSVSPSVAVSGSNVHIVWCDDRNNNKEIYYKRSTNIWRKLEK